MKKLEFELTDDCDQRPLQVLYRQNRQLDIFRLELVSHQAWVHILNATDNGYCVTENWLNPPKTFKTEIFTSEDSGLCAT